MGRKRHASEYLADSDSVSSASTSKMPGRSVRQEGVARMKSMRGLVLLRPIQSIALQLSYEVLDLSWIITANRYRGQLGTKDFFFTQNFADVCYTILYLANYK